MMRWLAERFMERGDSPGRVVDAFWQSRPTWPAEVLAVLLLAGVIGAALVHRRRHMEFPRAYRYALLMLRIAAIAIPLFVLLQPQLVAHFERQQKRTLAVLVDHSASMTIADSTDRAGGTRWQAAETAYQRLSKAVGEEVDIAAYAFADHAEPLSAISAGAPFGKRTAAGEALDQVRRELTGRSLSGVLVLSDGANNQGRDPLTAVEVLARAGVPVHTCLVGAEWPKDVAVSAVPETDTAFAGDPVMVQIRVQHRGYGGTAVRLQVTDGNKPVAEKVVILEGESGETMTTLTVVPQELGRREYRVEAPVQPGEITPANNIARFEIDVTKEPLRLLYVEHFPRWTYRFLKTAIERDHRLAGQLVLITEDPSQSPGREKATPSYPNSEEELSKFDVIVLGEVGPQDLSVNQLEWTRKHVVENGAGLIMIAGPKYMPSAFMDTPLAPLMPFESLAGGGDEQEAFVPVVTRAGSTHPLMRLGLGEEGLKAWEEMPPLQWACPIGALKPGATALAENARAGQASRGGAVIAAQPVGRGNVLFVGTDETWRWRYKVGNKYFYGFWGHAFQHLGMAHRLRESRAVRIALSEKDPVAADLPVQATVSFTVPLLDPGATPRVTLVSQRLEEGTSQPASGGRETFVLNQLPGQPLVYQGDIRFSRASQYRLGVEGLETRGQLTVQAAQVDAETARVRVDAELLRRMASLSGGQFANLEKLPELAEKLRVPPLRYAWTQELSLWDTWHLLALLTVVLTAEWILRKLRYLP